MSFAFTENGGEGRGGGGVGGGVQRQHRRVRRDRRGRHDLPPDHDHHTHHWVLRCMVSFTQKKQLYLKSIFNAFDNNTSCRLSCLCQSFTQTDYIAFTD